MSRLRYVGILPGRHVILHNGHVHEWFVVLICCGVIVGGISSLSNDAGYRDILKPTPQRVSKRNWDSAIPRELFSIGKEKEAILLRPWGLKVSKAGDIYVFDGGDKSIKKFSPQGAFVRKFGAGKGKGPGEFLSLTDFSVTEDDKVWTLDPENLRITVFGQDGALIFSPSSTRDYLFELFGINGDSLATFGQFIQDQRKNYIALDGWLAGDGRGGIVYAFLRAGCIVSFDRYGKLRFYVECLDPTPFPSVIATRRGGAVFLTIDRNAPYTSSRLDISLRS